MSQGGMIVKTKNVHQLLVIVVTKHGSLQDIFIFLAINIYEIFEFIFATSSYFFLRVLKLKVSC